MSDRVSMRAKSVRWPVMLFAHNFFKHPAMLGSAIPSSPFLVNQLMNEVRWNDTRVIVEFGPGVGTITREILKRMRSDATLVVIELNEEFVNYLRERIHDDRLRIVHASAADVCEVLEAQGLPQADCIISGIPYSLMTDDVRRQVLAQSRKALRTEGIMLVFQFTRTLLPYLRSSFSSVRQRFQFFNVLPARIFHCTP
jgi:phospholipid N-methyltransferase